MNESTKNTLISLFKSLEENMLMESSYDSVQGSTGIQDAIGSCISIVEMLYLLNGDKKI